MSDTNEENKVQLPHHEQQELCTTRLPYRQGRKLTAVKVYTINDESNHLLIFGVPSLNLRKEIKSHFQMYGKILQFYTVTDYPAEQFTENYHCVYENIQSARYAKKMLDTKNLYGGSLHVCYAPELESLDETRYKLMKRGRDVTNRLRYLRKDVEEPVEETQPLSDTVEVKKLDMSEINVISMSKQIRDVVKKRKKEPVMVIEKKFKPCFESDSNSTIGPSYSTIGTSNSKIGPTNSTIYAINKNSTSNSSTISKNNVSDIVEDVEVIDFTSTESETLTNIDETLNYNKFGSEVVRKVDSKPVNKIKFYINNKKI